MNKLRINLVVLALFASVLAACSTPAVKVELVGMDIHWSMETIHAKVNQPIEITLRNEGALDHNFVIEEYGIDVLLSPGDVEVVELSIDHAGTVKYICSIPGHEEAGMVGEIIVSE
jgi:nitrite reductase (NO-forming)